MKKITLSLLFIGVSMSAQLKVSGTHFADGVDEKRWSNATSDHETNDSFKNYTGESYITFASDTETEIAFDYVLNLTKGRCEVVFSGNGKFCKLAGISLGARGVGTSCDTQKFTLEPGKEYRLTLKGEKAKGNFKCNWKELAAGNQ